MAATTEETVRILRFDTGDAVKSISDLKRYISETKDALSDMEIGTEEYNATLKNLQAAQDAMRDSMNMGVRTVTAAKGSYNDLVHTMRELKQEWRATNDEAKRKELGERIAGINQELKNLDETVGVHSRKVGDYKESVKSALKETLDLLVQMKLEGKEGTAEYQAASEKANMLRDAIADVNEQVTKGASDTKAFDTALQGIAVASAGLSIVSQAFDKDSEAGKQLASVLKSVQVAILLLNAAKSIQNNLQKQGLLTQLATNVQLKISNALKALNAKITAQETGATVAQTIAQKALNAAMKANPVLLIVAGITALIGVITAATSAISGFINGSKAQAEQFEREYEALQKNIKAYEEYSAILEKSAAGDREKAFKRFSELIPVLNEAVNVYNKAISDAGRYLSDEEEERINKAEDALKGLREQYSTQLSAMKVDIISMLNAWNTEQTEKGMSDVDKKLKSVNSELLYTLTIIKDLENREGGIDSATAAQARVAAEAMAAAQTKEIQDAEAKRQREADEAARKARADAAKKAAEEAKKRAEKEKTEIRKAEDAKVALITDSLEKRSETERLHYERTKADLEARLQNEKDLTAEARKAINEQLQALEDAHWTEIAAIDKAAAEQETENARLRIENRLNMAKKGSDEYLKTAIELRQFELDRLEKKETESEEQFKARRIAAQKALDEAVEDQKKKGEEAAAKAKEERENLIKDGDVTKIKAAMEAKQAELDSMHRLEEESEDEFQKRMLEKQKEYNELSKGLVNARLNLYNTYAAALSGTFGSVADAVESLSDDEEKAAENTKALRIGGAILDTISGAIAAYTSAMKLPYPSNLIVGASNMATVFATGFANIAKLRSTSVKSSGAGTSSGVAVAAPATVQQVPVTRSLTSATEEDRLDQMASKQKVYLVYSDVEAAGNYVDVVDSESTFFGGK